MNCFDLLFFPPKFRKCSKFKKSSVAEQFLVAISVNSPWNSLKSEGMVSSEDQTVPPSLDAAGHRDSRPGGLH